MSDGMKRAFAATKATRQDTGPKLGEVAARITAHLQRFAADPATNAYDAANMTWPYTEPCARERGSKVGVHYKSFSGCRDMLVKADALAYLAWLDGGGVGKVDDWRRAVKGAT